MKINILYVFFSFNFFKQRKLYKIPQTFFLLLEAKQINSIVTSKLSSIRVWKDSAFLGSTINFKFMEMTNEGHHLTTNVPYIGLDYK
jgi:hypothetical protein